MNTKHLLSVAFIGLTLCSTSAIGADDKSAINAAIPEGRWKVISVEHDGKLNPAVDLKAGDHLVISGSDYKWEAKTYKEHGNVEFLPAEKPPFITFIDSSNQRSEGIYKLSGGHLSLCYWAGARPKDFKSSKQALLVILEREKSK